MSSDRCFRFYRNTSGKPSMLLDWEAGRPMELEVILGNPVKIARSKGLEMPRLQSMYALLKVSLAVTLSIWYYRLMIVDHLTQLAQKRRDEKIKDAKAKL